jgi:hypothetical protein
MQKNYLLFKEENEVFSSLSDPKEQSENEQKNNPNIIHDTIKLDDSSVEEEENEENKSEIREVIGRIINYIESDQINIEGLSLSPIKRSRSDSDDSTHDLDGDSFQDQSNLDLEKVLEQNDLEQKLINSQETKNKEEFKQDEEDNKSQTSDIVVPLNESSQINSENLVIGRNISGSISVTSKSSVNLNLSLLQLGGNLSSSQVDSKLETSEKIPTNRNEELSSSRNNEYYSNEEKSETPSTSPNNPELSFNFYDNIDVAKDFIAYQITSNETKYREQDTGQEQQKLVILKELYQSNGAPGPQILDNIFNIMIKSFSEADLNPKQALRALEIAKERKGIANGADPDDLPDDFYSEAEIKEDSELFDKYSDSEQKFQEYCYDCGIFSFLEELQGLRLCNIPKDSDEQFSNFVKELLQSHENQSSEELSENKFPLETIQASENAYNKTITEFRKISNQKRIEVEAEEKDGLGR